MRVVVHQPRKGSSLAAVEGNAVDIHAYFHGNALVSKCSLAGKTYGLICHHEGLQTRNNKVKALYGPMIVCGEQLQGLSEEEANQVQSYLNKYSFELSDIQLH